MQLAPMVSEKKRKSQEQDGNMTHLWHLGVIPDVVVVGPGGYRDVDLGVWHEAAAKVAAGQQQQPE